MNINLATIDLCPGQGGGGEAVIRTLDVTENGTYRATSGVDGYNPVRVNVSGGSVTPEEQEALDTLVNSSEGLLYTEVYDSMSATRKIDVLMSELYTLNVAGDDIYMHTNNLLKFNKDTLEFEKIAWMNSLNGQNFWKDSTGRLYDDTYIVDITTGQETYKDMSLVDYAGNNGKTNIFNGQYGTWIIGNQLSKFDETNQVFEGGYTINLPQYYAGILYDFPFKFKYQGHILFCTDSNTTYELKEYEDHIDVTDVTGVYFKLPVDWTIIKDRIFSTKDGNLFHIYNNNYYQYNPVNETWESFSLYNEKYFNSQYGISGNFMVGGTSDFSGSYYITNLGDTVTLTNWKKTTSVAVDLDSTQGITGYKEFSSGIGVNNIQNLSNINTNANNAFRLNNNRTIANRIEINCPFMSLNDNKIVTTDLLIANDTKLTYGPYIKTYVSEYRNPYSQRYFKTHTGRIFYINEGNRYEWNGSGFVNPTSAFVEVLNDNGCRVIVTPNNTFYYDNSSNIYLWNDTSSDFELINQNNSLIGDWSCWWDGTNLRNEAYKLVNSNNTWEWVADSIQDYVIGMYHYVNGNVYVLGINGQTVYKYDPTNKSYEKLGSYSTWSNTSFVAGGDIIFPYNDSAYYKIDFSKVIPSRDNYIETTTSIPYSSEYYGYMKYEYNDELLYATWEGIYACYDLTYEKPEVPASDGTYTLKATVLNGQVTYTWVADV